MFFKRIHWVDIVNLYSYIYIMNRSTKARLITSARKMIESDGVDAVNLRELGRLAGLSRSAIYRHFSGKNALLAQITRENWLQFQRYLNSLNRTMPEPEQRLRKISEQLYKIGRNSRDYYMLMMSAIWESRYDLEMDRFRTGMANGIEKVLKEIRIGQESIQNDSSSDLSRLLLLFIHGLIMFQNTQCNAVSLGSEEGISLIRRQIRLILNAS